MRRKNTVPSKWVLLALVASLTTGCTMGAVGKVTAVTMRATGAAASIVPVVGGPAHVAIDAAAAVVDASPL